MTAAAGAQDGRADPLSVGSDAGDRSRGAHYVSDSKSFLSQLNWA